jgi:hypothetical protein
LAAFSKAIPETNRVLGMALYSLNLSYFNPVYKDGTGRRAENSILYTTDLGLSGKELANSLPDKHLQSVIPDIHRMSGIKNTFNLTVFSLLH